MAYLRSSLVIPSHSLDIKDPSFRRTSLLPLSQLSLASSRLVSLRTSMIVPVDSFSRLSFADTLSLLVVATSSFADTLSLLGVATSLSADKPSLSPSLSPMSPFRPRPSDLLTLIVLSSSYTPYNTGLFIFGNC